MARSFSQKKKKNILQAEYLSKSLYLSQLSMRNKKNSLSFQVDLNAGQETRWAQDNYKENAIT